MKSAHNKCPRQRHRGRNDGCTSEGRLPLQQNVRAFKAGGEEEVGKRRKEERVRSKSKKRGKAGIDPIRG